MALIPVEHARRLASPAEAFCHGLRERRVGVRGFHTDDPGLFEALIAAADPKRDHTVSFVGGVFDGEVHAVLDVTLQAARTLTERFPGQKIDWQGDMILVDFPDGRIHGFLKTPNADERHRRRWQARVDKAQRQPSCSATRTTRRRRSSRGVALPVTSRPSDGAALLLGWTEPFRGSGDPKLCQ